MNSTRKGKEIGDLDQSDMTAMGYKVNPEQSLADIGYVNASMTQEKEWKDVSLHYDWVFTEAKLIDLSTDRFKLKFSSSLKLPSSSDLKGCLLQSVAVKHEHIFVSDMKYNAIHLFSQLRYSGRYFDFWRHFSCLFIVIFSCRKMAG